MTYVVENIIDVVNVRGRWIARVGFLDTDTGGRLTHEIKFLAEPQQQDITDAAVKFATLLNTPASEPEDVVRFRRLVALIRFRVKVRIILASGALPAVKIAAIQNAMDASDIDVPGDQ